MPDQIPDTIEPTTTNEPAGIEVESTHSTVRPRIPLALGVGFFVGVLAVGGTLGLRHFVYEPMEQKAAFIEVVSASNDELRAKSYDELIDLKSNVYNFSGRTGMLLLSMDEEERIDRAIATKR